MPDEFLIYETTRTYYLTFVSFEQRSEPILCLYLNWRH